MKKIYTTICMLTLAIAASAQLTLNKPETKVATSGFTANWGAVPNSDGYCVFVYDRKNVTADGEVTIADEDFNGITFGSIIEPAGGDEEYVDLSAYRYAETYGWSAYAFPNYIASMVAGLIYSPYMDLRGNDGKYKIIISAYCTNGDEIRVEIHGDKGKEIKTAKAVVAGGTTGITDVEFEFDNGCKDLFFSVINNTAKDGSPDYFDRIQTPSRYTTAKVLYYDCYASAADWTTPNGSMPYTFVVSPFTDLVKVDLTNRTSEVFNPETVGIQNIASASNILDSNVWYNLAGQRVSNPSKGLFIHNGKKVVLK